jgi:DivIVA domain-containing protein
VTAARFADAPPGARGYRTDDVDDFLDLVERRLAWSAGR